MPVKKENNIKKGKTAIKKTKAVHKDAKKSHLSLDVYNIKGEKESKISLSSEIFAAKVNTVLIAQAVRVYLANQRQGTISTKTRAEVSGSTRKIYKQKGTGRARHGDIKAPIFIGGGTAHGPHPRDFSLVMPKIMKRKALFGALSQKLEKGEVIAVSGLEKIDKKTKDMIKVLTNLKMVGDKKQEKILLVTPKVINNLQLAGRNIESLDFKLANLLNAYEILNHKKILFLESSFPVLENTFLKKEKE